MSDIHVLVLTDPNEGDLLGIWGPYDSLADAEAARDELMNWPLAPGTWEAIRIKKFPTTIPAVPAGLPQYPPGVRGGTTTGPGTVTWHSDFFAEATKETP